MSIFKNIFGKKTRSHNYEYEIADAMEPFTTASLFALDQKIFDITNINDLYTQRVLVFLFGAFDALCQHYRISNDEMLSMLYPYFRSTFHNLQHDTLESTILFLCDASADPTWIPIIRLGGQALVDWVKGDAISPARLATIVNH